MRTISTWALSLKADFCAPFIGLKTAIIPTLKKEKPASKVNKAHVEKTIHA